MTDKNKLLDRSIKAAERGEFITRQTIVTGRDFDETVLMTVPIEGITVTDLGGDFLTALVQGSIFKPILNPSNRLAEEVNLGNISAYLILELPESVINEKAIEVLDQNKDVIFKVKA